MSAEVPLAVLAEPFNDETPWPPVANPEVLSIQTRGRTDWLDGLDSGPRHESVGMALRTMLESYWTFTFDPGIPGSDFANPLSVALTHRLLEWLGNINVDPGDLRVSIPLPACAVAIARNAENGIVGHCVVPQAMRDWLRKYHSGGFPELIAPE